MYSVTINTQANEIVNDILREGKVEHSAEILEMLPEILCSVELDKNKILKCFERELKKRSGNPLQAIFSIFGLRLVNPNNAVRDLKDEIQTEENPECRDTADAFLRLNEKMLRESVTKMTDVLSSYEQNEKNSFQVHAQTQSEAIRELDKVSNSLKQLNAEYDNLISVVSQRSQYILGLAGKDNNSDNALACQIVELLEDFDMKAVWNAENTSFKESQLFTLYKCSKDSVRKSTPAIIQNDKIIAKGAKYVVQND